jgi:uncharacterized coiled-coil protein SlyX
MRKNKDNLNGSVELLARAIQGVVTEAVGKGNEIVLDEMIAMEGRLKQRIDNTNQRIDNTNQNMQSQFARQEKMIAEINRKAARQEEMITEINRKIG